MRDLPILAAEQHYQANALAYFRKIDRKPHADLPIVGRAITEIECAFMLDAPPDRALCAALRTFLEGPALLPASHAIRRIVEQRVLLLPGSEWAVLTVCEDLERFPIYEELRPGMQRWASIAAYASVVAYGPIGALLPPAPKGIRDDIGYIPGPRVQYPHRTSGTGTGTGSASENFTPPSRF